MSKGYTVSAALLVSALFATPLVMNSGGALATGERTASVTSTPVVQPIDVSPVAAPQAPVACARRVRVVYEGYAAASSQNCAITR